MAKFFVSTVRSKVTLKVIILSVILLVFYFEFAVFWTLPLSWIEKPKCAGVHCKKLLLVSDPQIVGPEWKKLFLLDLLAIWDSDSYLRKSFEKAVSFLKPDVIIFLGDLTDQGHTATDPEFRSYVERLRKIFKLPESLKSATVVVVPGDNDVGGIEDVLMPENVRRFERTFNQTEDCLMTDSVEFCKANLMTSVVQQSKYITSNIIRIALSHVPLTPKQSFFLKEAIKKIRPHLIFSGHLHTSSHYTAYENDVWTYRHSSITDSETRYRIFKFHEGFIHEIIVPTCSYRMGVDKMGFGAAFIDTKKQSVHYSVLWLPHRFRQILIYMIIILPVIIYLVIMLWKKMRKHMQMPSRKTNKLYSLP